MASSEHEALGIRIAHLGINTESADRAQAIAQQFCDLLGVERHETGVSSFAGDVVETMNEKGPGTLGHIGIHVDDLQEGIEFFQKRGYTFDENSQRFQDGVPFLIYFDQEIAGFAVHLTSR